MHSSWPLICRDHYENYLGPPSSFDMFSLDHGSTLQMLRFEDLFDGCTVLCSVGFSIFITMVDEETHQEAVLVADREPETCSNLFAITLHYIGEHLATIPLFTSKAGISDLDRQFAAQYGKNAFYFTKPLLFPEGFDTVSVGGVEGEFFLAIFISHEEHEFLKAHGADALESKLEEANIDPFCLSRPSVV